MPGALRQIFVYAPLYITHPAQRASKCLVTVSEIGSSQHWLYLDTARFRTRLQPVADLGDALPLGQRLDGCA